MADFENFEDDEIQPVNARVVTPNDRIKQLEDEIEALKGKKKADLVNVFQNPQGLMQELSLSDKQAQNLKSLLVGSGTGLTHKLLSQHIGDIPASVAGALLSSWLAKNFIK